MKAQQAASTAKYVIFLASIISFSVGGIWIDRRMFRGLKLKRSQSDDETLPLKTPASALTNNGLRKIIGGREGNPSNINNCEEILAVYLDALDAKFDNRRAARLNANGDAKNRGGKRMFDLYEPEATCLTEERFGSDERYSAFGDGPKFVCGVDVIADNARRRQSSSNSGTSNNNNGECLVYSIGSNNDVSFEKAVHTFMAGCEIHTFDPTLTDEPFVGDEYAIFHPWGLGTDGGKEGNTMHGRKKGGPQMSFETVFRELGHLNRTIDVLKIDCQGCEYAAMPPLFDLIAAGKVQVDQLVIEMHAPKAENGPRILNDFFLAADKAKLRIFHKERNSWGCDGYRCVEYAFASESFLRIANGAEVCPGYGED